MSISIRSIIVRHIIAFVVVFSVTLLVVATANAHTFNPPFLWYSSTAKFQNFTANYNAGVNSATNDYNATDLTVTKVSNLSGRDVVNFYDYNGGRDYPIGRAVAWATVNGTSVLCLKSDGTGVIGNCNTTTKRANLGELRFNIYYKGYIDNNTGFILRHEAGHVFGLQHPPDCNETSVMVDTYCALRPNVLAQHDVSYLNNNY